MFQFSDALSCLEAAEERYSNIQTMKTNLQNEYKIIVNKVSTLLDELFDKSSLIERLKAKLSMIHMFYNIQILPKVKLFNYL